MFSKDGESSAHFLAQLGLDFTLGSCPARTSARRACHATPRRRWRSAPCANGLWPCRCEIRRTCWGALLVGVGHLLDALGGADLVHQVHEPPDCRPIRHSALSTWGNATAAAFAYWMVLSWVIGTAPGSACSRSSGSDMGGLAGIVGALWHRHGPHAHFCKVSRMCQAQAAALRVRTCRDALVASVFESAWALAARAAAARSLSFCWGVCPDTASAGWFAHGHGRGAKTGHGFTRQPLVSVFDQLKMRFGFRVMKLTATPLCPARPVRPMRGVVGRRAGKVVIHHGGQLGNINPACGQIGRHHHPPAFILNSCKDLGARVWLSPP